MLSHLGLVKTHSFYEAPILKSGNPFKVLIYSPGYRMLTDQNSVLLEELASYGYVVFGMSHPNDTPFISTDDHAFEVFAKNPELEKEIDEKLISDTMEELCKTNLQEAKEKIYRNMAKKFPKTVAYLKTRINDTTDLLDRLEELNQQKGFFFKTLDLDKIGIMGMSLGRPTAILTCLEDERCKAGVSIDGFLLGDLFETQVNFPSLLITSEQTALIKDNQIIDCFDEVFSSRSKAESSRVSIKHTTHMNLTDLSLFGPFLKLTGVLGKTRGRDCLKTMNDHVRRFFYKYLT